ncbi:MAG: PfkB family carbohydrate kinase [Nocardioides sp.]|nr:PfkB family carbohydrate kinase [Nocardioides sp.]
MRAGSAVPVVVVGEALVDVVLRSDGGRHEAPGGSPLNVAVGLARLGVPTTLLTTLGDDAYGGLVRDHLAASGVQTVASPQSVTSTATARLDADGQATYDFALSWDLPALPLPEAALFHCGSLAAFLAPGSATVDALLDQAVARGMVTTFDPNVRADLLGSPAATWARTRAVAARCDLVKLSDEDARHLAAGLPAEDRTEDPVRDVASALRGGRTQVVVVTEGSRGPYAHGRAEGVRLRPGPEVPVADTVGAGDSFMAALLAVLAGRRSEGLDALPPDEELGGLLAAADAAARVTVTRPGADPPWRHELPAGWPLPAAGSADVR